MGGEPQIIVGVGSSNAWDLLAWADSIRTDLRLERYTGANKHDMRLDCFPDIKRPENDVRAFGVDVLQRLEVFLRLF